jgi:hypothetical protein
VSAVWDGITRAATIYPDAARLRHDLADAAKRYDWDRVLEILAVDASLVNTVRPDGTSCYAPLHQAAHGDAPAHVVERLLALGAFRTLRDARGERPCDIALRRGHAALRDILAPVLRRSIPGDTLDALQARFHDVILGRAERLVREHQLRLPQLAPLLECDPPEMSFTIPGMYGGFSYRLARAGENPLLVSESWCRVVGGSEQRHEISPAGSTLVEEGW